MWLKDKPESLAMEMLTVVRSATGRDGVIKMALRSFGYGQVHR